MMKTKYNYIFFRKSVISDISDSKQVWTCHANRSGATIGTIGWDPSWELYCVQFNENAIFSASCLTDITDFLEQLNASKKNNIVDGLVMSHLARAGKLTEYLEEKNNDEVSTD